MKLKIYFRHLVFLEMNYILLRRYLRQSHRRLHQYNANNLGTKCLLEYTHEESTRF